MDYKYQPTTPPPFNGVRTVTEQTNAVMKRVYVRMFVGLLISAFCALGVASSVSAMQFFFGNQLVFWGMLIACRPRHASSSSASSQLLWDAGSRRYSSSIR